MNRTSFENFELLTGIPGSPDEVGYDLSVSTVYDDIRNARFEEDSSVSLGIWERKLKKANWELTEQLCVDALKTKSKDFQILGWLIEALVVLDGFDGITRGIQILTKFIEVFWETGYPRKENNSSDAEQKLRICDWIFDIVEKRSKFIPFAMDNMNNFINLYQYEYALDLKNIAIRSPASAAQVLEDAKRDGHKELEDILATVKAFSPQKVEKIINAENSIKHAKTSLDEILLIQTGKNINSFSGLIRNLEKIDRLLENSKINSADDSGTSTLDLLDMKSSDTKSRNAIYHSISELAKQLAVLEKHSPSAFMLNLVVSWKDKNLLEIMDDLKSGNSEAHRLLKQLLNI